MAWRLTGTSAASSRAVAAPRAPITASSCRRVGSASAAKTSSELLGVGTDLLALELPAAGVVLVVLALPVDRQVEGGEAGLDDAQPGAVALGGQRELDQRAVARSRLQAGRIRPAPGEEPRRVDRLDDAVAGAVLLPPDGEPAAGSQVEFGGLAEPLREVLRGGQHGPDPLDRCLDVDVAFDPVVCHNATLRLHVETRNPSVALSPARHSPTTPSRPRSGRAAPPAAAAPLRAPSPRPPEPGSPAGPA